MNKVCDFVGHVFTRPNVRRKRLGMPLACQTIALAVMLCAGIYFTYTSGPSLMEGADDIYNRRLQSLCESNDDDKDDRDGCPKAAEPGGLAVLYMMGSIYLFLAIAIVCDEFFVPSLEVIADRLQVSDDIAGATLMAAGGSAPELATSLIGTFTGSDIGFGTIVGSAVFNVLFVIAMCVIYTPDSMAPLKLTWWPLARDCSCYVVTLATLAIFFGATSPGKIELWEAIVQFILYLCYCTIMAFNEQLQGYFGVQIAPSEDEEEGDLKETADMEMSTFLRPSRFRADIYKMIISQDQQMVDSAGVNIVSRIKGTVQDVFEQIDTEKTGQIKVQDMQRVLELLNEDKTSPITAENAKVVVDKLDINGDGHIDLNEFTIWYTKSQHRLHSEARKSFVKFDDDGSDSIPFDKLKDLLDDLEVQFTPEELADAAETLKECGARIPFDNFTNWYETSLFWEKKREAAEALADSAEGIWGDLLDFPKATPMANVMFILTAPITFTLACTVGIRDVRIPGNEGFCYWVFVCSICWIGVYAYLLVDWLTIFGATIRVPSVVMGLTILAAGTSVPDLLSSVVVAKEGKGDMAVSSSIGSNIFDVTVGLPVPWLLFNLVYGCPVLVEASNLEVSIIVLLGMVLLVILSIMWSEWRLSKTLGGIMMALYVIFVVQDVLRVYLTTNVVC
mmetsp:Transcript_1367/g.2211  ORF Transcript_1367/g.2211 Transcript_1367/m.2211 type:complete len:676 (-) Transcript_1367:614-2641(-)